MEKCPYKKLDEIIERDRDILEKLNSGSKKVRGKKKTKK